MSDEMDDMTKVYCNVCRAPLGELGGEVSGVGILCPRCGRKYTIRMHEDSMMLKSYQTKTKKIHTDPEPA